MIKETVNPKGTPTFTLTNEFGEVKLKFTIPNLIVLSGKNWMVSRFAGTPNVMSHIAVGSGVAPAALADTTLGTEIGRVAMLVAGGVVTNSTIFFSATFGPGVSTGTIGEAGIFNAASGGIMLSRVVVTPFVKSALDTLTIEWNVEVN